MLSMIAPRKEDTQDAVDDCPKEGGEHKGCGQWLPQGRRRAQRMRSMIAPRKESTKDAVNDCPKEGGEHKGCCQ